MSKDSYTLKEVEAAIRKSIRGRGINTHPNVDIDAVIAELTRSYTPEADEVYAYTDNNGYEHFFKHGFADGVKGNERPLTPDEVPALKIAIGALVAIRDLSGNELSCRRTAEQGLDQINQRIGREK